MQTHRGGGGTSPDPRRFAEPVLTDAPGFGPAQPGGVVAAFARRSPWETRYRAAVIASDMVAVLCSVVLGYWTGRGYYGPAVGALQPWLGIITLVLATACLALGGAWEHRVLGHGSEEIRRVVRAIAACAVLLALAGIAQKALVTRPWVFGFVPLAGVLCLIGRLVLRKVLHRRRSRGECMLRMLAVGTHEAVENLIVRTRNDQHTGWVVGGVCTPTGTGGDGGAEVLGVPVVGDLDGVSGAARTARFQAVAVAPAPGWSSQRLHRLAWELEGTGCELVVEPGLMEVAGPRLHVAPVDGLPLLRLTEPQLTGISRVAKNVIDRLGAIVLLVLIAPLLIAVAVAVKLDGGPVFFHQERVGRNGKTFRMLKFRSMIVGAERLRPELEAANDGSGPLFKLRCDPRVTKVGAHLRKWSFDELPQLVNVLAGSMSLVGPRPPLPDEVACYSTDARRKLLVRPGLTGLWQISGRSDLTWEESVRLDLRYVENWSLALDAVILWKTIGAVMRSSGAY